MQQFKELFIITERELLHSADGIPIIKHQVMAMLWDLSIEVTGSDGSRFTSDHHQCGVAAVVPQELVMHATPSLLGQWPWHGALYHRINRNKPAYACGLTVVSKFYTITAAHCTYPREKHTKLVPSEMLVYLGISNIELPGFLLRQFAVKSIVRHENYQTDDVRYDIALLKVAQPGIEFNNYIRPICFWRGDASEAAIVGKNGYSPGWGLNENGELPPELQHAVMPIVSRWRFVLVSEMEHQLEEAIVEVGYTSRKMACGFSEEL
ncbi:transmembrane protease serine 3-like [Ochlerotatus camptorhynchus]|uniref:transmembrane protease serine 3-like n=1 Tax=Ochlerotatus camptorhynchus TaxID=644619 RepID=UPI0031D07F99